MINKYKHASRGWKRIAILNFLYHIEYYFSMDYMIKYENILYQFVYIKLLMGQHHMKDFRLIHSWIDLDDGTFI